MQCAESLRVQAYFDAEVDAVAAVDIERHIEHCADCRALFQDLERVRTVLRRDSSYVRAPSALKAQILRGLQEMGAPGEKAAAGAGPASPRRPAPVSFWPRAFWAGAISGVGGTALAAGLAFLLLRPTLPDPLVEELVNAHVRSLMPTHLIDVISTDRHTVKPWFAGHADVSPVVADFEPQGYRLVGGRADYLNHQRSAVVVYQHGSHVVNVFSWAGNGRALPSDVTRNGYHFAFWKTGNIDYCAVADTSRDELTRLVLLLQELGNREGRD
ncbi:MAG: zf-HC2 domain-containing protein [Pseudomonadota bacterium]|nr:zf-HC2 domain-containing protein [Pseudomonadota bacterium]